MTFLKSEYFLLIQRILETRPLLYRWGCSRVISHMIINIPCAHAASELRIIFLCSSTFLPGLSMMAVYVECSRPADDHLLVAVLKCWSESEIHNSNTSSSSQHYFESSSSNLLMRQNGTMGTSETVLVWIGQFTNGQFHEKRNQGAKFKNFNYLNVNM